MYSRGEQRLQHTSGHVRISVVGSRLVAYTMYRTGSLVTDGVSYKGVQAYSPVYDIVSARCSTVVISHSPALAWIRLIANVKKCQALELCAFAFGFPNLREEARKSSDELSDDD